MSDRQGWWVYTLHISGFKKLGKFGLYQADW
jgi:hypothetical protein